ncbi:hypothetical protein LIER_39728 [Lithospermum erythrorhizon]|uniref:Uncharacterized protein n=1 Tax=Lithospermum erythrorhizon TaxID=34254 RepID=A0AAV3QLZ5_LITER
MSASDRNGTVKIVAIGSIVERILQTTTINISKLSNLGEHYDLNSVRSEFHQKIFLILLRRSFGKHNEGQRKMLLLGYFNDHDSEGSSQSASNTPSQQPSEHTKESSDNAKQAICNSSPLSPFKRQMSQISINPGSYAKKKILLQESETNEEGDGSAK